MSPTEPKLLIEFLEKRFNDHEAAAQLAPLLHSTISDNLTGEFRFVYELLQNAHDAGAENKELAVTLTENKLIFSHTGSHFTAENITALCSSCRSDKHDAVTQEETIGHKGIGFKTVFVPAHLVSVFSDKFAFYFVEPTPPNKDIPWQLIPHWLDEVPTWVDKSRVTFVLELRDADFIASIREELLFLANKPLYLLFLPRITSFKINIDKEVSLILSTNRICDYPIEQVTIEGIGQHYLYSYEVAVPEGVKEKLKARSGNYPARIFRDKNVRLCFAVSNDLTARTEPQPLCCYLPTEVILGLPYTINTGFLLETNRTSLIAQNPWNQMLLGMIAKQQFVWLRSLANNEKLRFYVLALISSPDITIVDRVYKKTFQEAFLAAAKSQPFIPTVTENYVTLTAVVFDRTGFYSKFHSAIKCERKENVASNELQAVDIFIKKMNITDVSVQIFNYQKLIAEIELFAQQLNTPEFNFKLCQFIGAALGADKIKPEEIFDKKFILTTDQRLASPRELMLPTLEDLTVAPPKDLNIMLVHSEVAKDRATLEKMGIAPLSIIEIIRRIILPEIKQPDFWKSAEKLIATTIFMCQAYHQEEDETSIHFLTLDEKKELTFFPLLTQKQTVVKPARECHMGTEYTKKDIGDLQIDPADLIATCYLERLSEQQAWYDFFSFIGAGECLTLRCITLNLKVSENASSLATPNLIEEYIKYLHQERFIKKLSNKQQILDLSYFDNLHLLWTSENRNYEKAFWNQVQHHWPFPESKYRMTKGGDTLIPSYLSFVVQHYAHIWIDDQHYVDPFGSSNCYAPHLKKELGALPGINFADIELTPEQAEYFGFKIKFDLEALLIIVKNLITTKQFDFFCKEILKLDAVKLITLQQSLPKKLKLMAHDGKLYPVNKLKHLPIDILPSAENAAELLYLPKGFNAEEAKKITELFGITTVKADAPSFLGDSDDAAQAELDILIKKALPFFALLEQSPEDKFLTALSGKWQALKLVARIGLCIKIKEQSYQRIGAYLDGSTLYIHVRPPILRSSHGLIFDMPAFANQLIAYFGLQHVSFNDIDFALKGFTQETLTQAGYPQQVANKYASMCAILAARQISATPTESVTSTEAILAEPPVVATGEQLQKLTLDADAKKAKPEPKHQKEKAAEAVAIVDAPPKTEIDFEGYDFNQPSLKADDTPPKPYNLHGQKGKEKTPEQPKAKKNLSPAEKKTLKELGDAGEQFVFQWLRHRYQKKYEILCETSDTKTGFIVHAKDHKDQCIIEVIWLNKDLPSDQEDSFEHVDFIIKRNKSEVGTKKAKVDERYIEVKATQQQSAQFFISPLELTVAVRYKDRYRIFRVSDLGSKTPTLKKIKDPMRLLTSEHLTLSGESLTMRLT